MDKSNKEGIRHKIFDMVNSENDISGSKCMSSKRIGLTDALN